MVEDPNNPRLWLVTGVRYSDVKDCYPEFLSSLKEGTIMQVFAACKEAGAFKNLKAVMSWKGKILNVGVISSKMRDVAATYMDDEGYMEVRVVEGSIGDKDFWVEPLLDAPLRPMAQRVALPPLPFSENLVPFRTAGEACRSYATRQLEQMMQEIEDNINRWTWTDLRSHVLQLVQTLHSYPEYCLHSLCEEESKRLRETIGRLREILQRLDQVTGMAECVLQLKKEYDYIEWLEHTYSKEDVCGKIYKEELSELENLAINPFGLCTQFFGQLVGENHDLESNKEVLTSALNKINEWLKGFMHGWYVRTKGSTARLAHTIKCEQLTRRELYGYYCCEILAKYLRGVLKGKYTIDEMLGHYVEPNSKPLSIVADETNIIPIEEIDPNNIINGGFDKHRVVETVREVAAIIQSEPYKYTHLMKVMIDHRVILLQQVDYSKFSNALADWVKDNPIEPKKVKESIRQRFKKIMDNHGLDAGKALRPYWLWDDTDLDRQICVHIGAIFERNGFSKPRKLAL